MNKKIILFICFSLLSMGVFSQLKFGVKGGINYTFPNYVFKTEVKLEYVEPFYVINTYKEKKPKTQGIAPLFGVFLDIKIADGLSFQPELLFSFRHYNAVVEELYEDTMVSILTQNYGYHKLLYLEVPLLFKFNSRINTGRYGRDDFFGFFIGPVLGVKLTESFIGESTVTFEGYGQKSINSSKDDLKSNVDHTTFDLGVTGGIMYDMEKGLRVGLRYNRSIFSVNKEDYPKVGFNILQLTVGWNFIKQ
jgi:hypothetical protein